MKRVVLIFMPPPKQECGKEPLLDLKPVKEASVGPLGVPGVFPGVGEDTTDWSLILQGSKALAMALRQQPEGAEGTQSWSEGVCCTGSWLLFH